MPVLEYCLKDLRNSTIFTLCGFPYIKVSRFDNAMGGNYSACHNMHGQEVFLHENTKVHIVAHLEDYYEPKRKTYP